MAKILEREKARTFREQGKSIKVIARLLGVSSSTVSSWCRDIILNPQQFKRLQKRQHAAGLKAVLKYAESKRNIRIEREKELCRLGKRDVGELTKRDLFVVGLALYWGEGYKSGNGELGFTNSNPEMIKFILVWFKRVFAVHAEDFILRVSINSLHQARLQDVEKFWSDTTGLPLSQFSKGSLIKTQSKKVYANPKHHFGTLRVKVRRGTDLRRRILGGIEALKYAFES